jgi:bacterial/archaeal transporter family protein
MGIVALIGCLVTILAWGAGGIFDKLGVRGVDPFQAVLVRLVFATAMILAFCAATGRLRPALHFETKTYLFLLISGLLGSVVGQMAYYLAVKHAPASQVIPVTATYPVVGFVLAVLFLREQPTLPKIAGVICVVLGLMLVAGGKNEKAPAPVERTQVNGPAVHGGGVTAVSEAEEGDAREGRGH